MENQEQTFNRLVRQYSDRLYWHIRYIVGTHADADDVLQEVFLKAWKSLPSFRGESSEYSWQMCSQVHCALLLHREKISS